MVGSVGSQSSFDRAGSSRAEDEPKSFGFSAGTLGNATRQCRRRSDAPGPTGHGASLLLLHWRVAFPRVPALNPKLFGSSSARELPARSKDDWEPTDPTIPF